MLDQLVTLVLSLADYIRRPETLALIGAVIAASGVQEAIKVKVTKLVDDETVKLGEKTNLLISLALSSLVVSLDAYMSHLQSSPGTLGTHTVAVMGLMNVAYLAGVKPASAWLQSVLEDARNFRQINSNSTAPAADNSGDVLNV